MEVVVGVASYWKSRVHESGLGILARANVTASKNILESGQADLAAFMGGRIHQFSSELEGQEMRRWLLHLQQNRLVGQSVEFDDSAVTDTVKEYRALWIYLSRNPQPREVIHLVNHVHRPRAQDLFDSLESERTAILGPNQPTFHVRPTSEFLSIEDRQTLALSAEQARFIEREKTNPLVRRIGLSLPAWVKRTAEDQYIAGLSAEYLPSERLILASESAKVPKLETL